MRRGPVASAGHPLPAQMAQPAGRAKGQTRHPQSSSIISTARRSAKLLEQRLALVAKAVPVTDETAVDRKLRPAGAVDLPPTPTGAADHRAVTTNRSPQAYAAHPDQEIFASLPGAGPVLGPRLLASLGSQRERFGAAADLQQYTGHRAGDQDAAAALVTFTGAISVPSSTSKASTSMPRKAFCGAAGRRPITCNNGPRAVRITRPCGRWPSNGSGSSSVAGRIAHPIRKPIYEAALRKSGSPLVALVRPRGTGQKSL